jgi:tRNA modification GTPase
VSSRTQFQLDDTIGALASAAGPAARGIIRISGPRALECLNGWFEPADGARWQSARVAACHAGALTLTGVRSPLSVLVYAWPNGRSYTGEPLVEVHVPGSPPFVEAVLVRVFEAGVRPAGPGEFTLRAFLAGRMDLLQAEAVLGVIDAAEDQALTVALRQLAGGLSGRMTQVRGELLDLLADVEAGLDFVEDGIEFVSRSELACRVRRAEQTIGELVRRCHGRAQSIAQRRVVLAGLPNAGKSTLFNALLGRDAALVSSIAGTTRDYLSGALEWNGLAIELIDTPGWEADVTDAGTTPDADAAASLTRRSQELGTQQREQADLVLWCAPLDPESKQQDDEDRLRSEQIDSGRPRVIVRTKADLVGQSGSGRTESAEIIVSAKTGDGLAQLVDRCAQLLGAATSGDEEILGTTAARCADSLTGCREALARAAAAAESGAGDEILAIELREALEHLGRVLGTVYTDDVLDRIFSRFCIGK